MQERTNQQTNQRKIDRKRKQNENSYFVIIILFKQQIGTINNSNEWHDMYSMHFGVLMYTAQTENRKKRCAGETIRTKKKQI